LTLVEVVKTNPDGTTTVVPTLTGRFFLDPPTELPLVNTVELWNLINLTPDTHPIHVHLSQFRLVERRPFDVDAYLANNSQIVFTGPPVPPEANENGYKDTIRANPGEVTTILVPFEVPTLTLCSTTPRAWRCALLVTS
jgi:spore coat protein A